MSKTPYAETEALLAILEDRPDDAEKMLRDSFDAEIITLWRASFALSSMCQRILKERQHGLDTEGRLREY